MLFTNEVGQAIEGPNVPQQLRPSSAIGLKYQTPTTHKGVNLPPEVLDKLESMWKDLPGFEFIPTAPARLESYLYGIDELGNTAVKPGALIDVAPLEPEVQGAKYWSSKYGFRYKIEQTFSYASMSDVKQGDSRLGNYNLDLPMKWTIFEARDAGTAGWISAQIEYQTSLSGDQGQTAQTNLGTLTNPTGFWSTHSGFRVPELAWQQSFDASHMVVLAGVINQSNYIDANAYANSGRGHFINSALSYRCRHTATA